MKYKKINHTHGIIIMLLLAGIALPAIMSFYYMASRSPSWLLVQAGSGCMAGFCAVALASRLRTHAMRFLLALFLIVPLWFLGFFQAGSYYFQGCSFNRRFFFHLSLDNLVVGWRAYPGLVVLFTVMVSILVILIWFSVKKKKFSSIPAHMLVAGLLAGTVLQYSVRDMASYMLVHSRSASDAVKAMTKEDFLRLGLNVKALSNNNFSARAGKNLVLVYLESLERIYTEKSIFPGLTPELDNLAEKGLVFENLRQTAGSGWTMGGIVSSQCGTPLLWDDVLAGHNDIMARGFLDSATCLGDILHRAGYVQEFLGGASKRYGGKSRFFKAHGYDYVYGFDELRSRLENPDFYWGWGLYDESLFDMAAEDFERLAASGRPFNITLLTVDTHHPEGRPSPSCSPYNVIHGNSILDAVHCTDQLLGKFIKRISGNPAFRNTVVAIMSDHLAMRNDAEPLYPPEYDRKLLFLALGSGQGRVSVNATQLDIAPTLLHLLDVATDAQFLVGKNLLEEGSGIRDLRTPGLLDAVTYINTRWFSQPSFRLCQGETVMGYAGNDTMIVGDMSLPLYMDGVPVEHSRFAQDMSLLVLITDEGKIANAAVMPDTLVCSQLYLMPEDRFLLVRPAASLDGVEVIAGGDNCRLKDIGKFDSLEQVAIGPGVCELFSGGKNDETQETAGALGQYRDCKAVFLNRLCGGRLRKVAARFNPESGELFIPKLAVIPDTFASVVLKRIRPDIFMLEKYDDIANPSVADNGQLIYARYEGKELTIPLVLCRNRQAGSAELELISNDPLLLKVVRGNFDCDETWH